MEKILIRENEGKQVQAVQLANNQAQRINTELAQAMDALGVEFDDKAFKDCILGDCEGTKTAYFNALEADLENIKNPGVREGMRKDAQQAFAEFAEIARTLKNETTLKQYLSIDNGVCFLTKEGEAALKESIRTYAEGPEEIEVFNQLSAIVNALNEFFKGTIPPAWQAFIEIKNGVFCPNSQIDYKWIVEGRKNN